MKILYLITRAELGGAQVHLHDLLRGFKNRCEMVLGTGEEGYLTEAAAALNVSFEVIPGLVQPISPWNDVRAILGVSKLIRKTRPDLVHVHTSKAGLVGRAAAKFAGVPSVFTAHTWCFAEGTSWKWKLAGLPCERLMARWGARTIAVSGANRSVALRHAVGTDEKLTTIHNGIPDTSCRASHGRNTIPKIVMIARCVRQKSQILLLRAMATVTLPFEIVFVGDGPTRSSLEEEACRLGLGNRISFLGNRLDIAEILSVADIFALPTNWEGFPLTILEAMRAGLPVVASAVGGVVEAVIDGETGFLVPSGAEAELRDRLVALLSDASLRRSMGDGGRSRYESNFTLPVMLDKTFAVYENLLADTTVSKSVAALEAVRP